MNTHNPLVSIIIPVFNGSNYLESAITSALNQTYKNVEILVINDGSNDDLATEKIALKFGKKIRYFFQENRGCGAALNTGIRNMQGELFSWLSHDDLYRPKKIERQVAKYLTQANPSSIIFSGYVIRDEHNRRLGSNLAHRYLSAEQLAKPLYPLLRGLIHGCTLLIPKHLFDQIAYFNENMRTTQDYALWFDFFRRAPLIYDDHVNVIARTHSEQDTQKINAIHLQEGNALWANFAKQLTPQEMIDLDGSELQFLCNLRDYLAITPFNEARNAINQMAQICASQQNLGKTGDKLVSTKSPANSGLSVTPPTKTKRQNYADYEGLVVNKLKPYIPSLIWNSSTKLYRTLRNIISSILWALGIRSAFSYIQRQCSHLKMRYELYREENHT